MSLDDLRRLYEDRRCEDAWTLYRLLSGDDPAWHLYGALSAYRLGNISGARDAAETGLLARPQGELLARLLFMAGVTHREWGDYAASLKRFEALLRFWRRHTEQRLLLEAAAFHNLGLTYYSQREYTKALASALKSARLYRKWQDLPNWAAALRNAAWVCCAIGDAEQAGQLLSEIERTHTDEAGRWHQQVGRAYLALIEGQHDWCIELAYSVARDADGDVQVQGAWLVGHAYLRQGDLGRAREWADMAERAARVLSDTRSLKDAGELLRAIEAAEQRGA